MENDTLFKAIKEMVKQFENIKNEDEYRLKGVDLVFHTFNLDVYDAEIIYDLAVFGDGVYLTDTDSEVEFNIKYNADGTFTATEVKYYGDYKKSFEFNKIPVKLMLSELNAIAKEEWD